MYDFVENAAEPDMVNQLSPFRSIVADITQSFNGSIIRLPLRTADQAKDSRILDLDRKPTEIAEIKDIFEGFAEELSHSLLFLRNVSSITLRIGDQIFAQATARKFRGGTDITSSLSINELYQSVLVRGEQLSKNESYVLEVSSRKNGSQATVIKYALTHHMRRHIAGNMDLEEWARTYKLLPWIAIASPLSQVRTLACQRLQIYILTGFGISRVPGILAGFSAHSPFQSQVVNRLTSTECSPSGRTARLSTQETTPLSAAPPRVARGLSGINGFLRSA